MPAKKLKTPLKNVRAASRTQITKSTVVTKRSLTKTVISRASPEWVSGSMALFSMGAPSPALQANARRSSVYVRKSTKSQLFTKSMKSDMDAMFKKPGTIVFSPPGVKTRARRSSIYRSSGQFPNLPKVFSPGSKTKAPKTGSFFTPLIILKSPKKSTAAIASPGKGASTPKTKRSATQSPIISARAAKRSTVKRSVQKTPERSPQKSASPKRFASPEATPRRRRAAARESKTKSPVKHSPAAARKSVSPKRSKTSRSPSKIPKRATSPAKAKRSKTPRSQARSPKRAVSPAKKNRSTTETPRSQARSPKRAVSPAESQRSQSRSPKRVISPAKTKRSTTETQRSQSRSPKRAFSPAKAKRSTRRTMAAADISALHASPKRHGSPKSMPRAPKQQSPQPKKKAKTPTPVAKTPTKMKAKSPGSVMSSHKKIVRKRTGSPVVLLTDITPAKRRLPSPMKPRPYSSKKAATESINNSFEKSHQKIITPLKKPPQLVFSSKKRMMKNSPVNPKPLKQAKMTPKPAKSPQKVNIPKLASTPGRTKTLEKSTSPQMLIPKIASTPRKVNTPILVTSSRKVKTPKPTSPIQRKKTPSPKKMKTISPAQATPRQVKRVKDLMSQQSRTPQTQKKLSTPATKSKYLTPKSIKNSVSQRRVKSTVKQVSILQINDNANNSVISNDVVIASVMEQSVEDDTSLYSYEQEEMDLSTSYYGLGRCTIL